VKLGADIVDFQQLMEAGLVAAEIVISRTRPMDPVQLSLLDD